MIARTPALVFVFTVLFASTLSVPVFAQGKAPEQTLITNVNIFDGNSEMLGLGQDVLVENNLIKKIGKGLIAGADATVIDGSGMTMTPGLIDMHQHLMLGGPDGLF